MISLAKTIAEGMRDPLVSGLIGMFGIAALLILVIWHKDKCVKQMSEDHDTQLDALSQKVFGELNCLNKILSRQVTLLEVLIFKGKKP